MALARAAVVPGRALPVALTARFPGVEGAGEDSWQELVIAALGCEDWVRVEIGSDHDLLGPFAVAVLRRHGLRYPPNMTTLGPLLDVARGTTLVLGLGGDELLKGWPHRRLRRLVRGERRPVRGDGRRVARALIPRAARRARASMMRTRPGAVAGVPPWLSPPGGGDARRTAARTPRRSAGAVAASNSPSPNGSAWVPWKADERHIALHAAACDSRAAEHDVRVSSPLLSEGVLRALSAAGGLSGFDGRTAAMRAIFTGLLPDAVLARETKATLGALLWSERTLRVARELAADGFTPFPKLVDRAALLAEWSLPCPAGPSALLLHATWLAAHGAAGDGGVRLDVAPDAR